MHYHELSVHSMAAELERTLVHRRLEQQAGRQAVFSARQRDLTVPRSRSGLRRSLANFRFGAWVLRPW